MPPSLQHRDVIANGIRIHRVEAGTGPLLLLCHGFPEGWYSWRHQLEALAGAGYRVAAPDMRGYGHTECPADIAAYSILDIVGDMVGLVAALGEQQAFIIGHDWARRAHGTPRSFAPTSSRPWLRSAFLSARAALRRRSRCCAKPGSSRIIGFIFRSPAWPRRSSSATRARPCAACVTRSPETLPRRPAN